jgi:hypothetical protein
MASVGKSVPCHTHVDLLARLDPESRPFLESNLKEPPLLSGSILILGSVNHVGSLFSFFLLSLHGRTFIFSSVRHGFEFLQCGALPVMCFGFINLTNSSYKYHKPIIVIGVMFTNLANHI